MEKKHSILGIVSFCLSIAVGLLVFVIFIIAGILNQGHVEHGHQYPGQKLIGFAIIGLIAIDILAAALGIGSICQTEKKRLFGILGLSISSATMLGTIGLIIIGLVFMSKVAR